MQRRRNSKTINFGAIHNDLFLASRYGILEKAREIINSYGLSLSPKWSQGYVFLVEALKNGHSDVAKLLLMNGSRITNEKENENNSNTPLYYAVQKGYLDIVEMLLNKGLNIEAKNCKGQTPLYWAIDHKNIEITELFLNRGADVKVSDNDGISLLHLAAEKGCVQTVEYILQKGADVNSMVINGCKKGYTPLHMAIESDNEKISTLLLSKGANIEFKAEDDITPLHIASSMSKNGLIVEDLLHHGACADSLTLKQGYTPLMIAINSKNETVVKLLLQHTTNIDSQAKDGCTILNLAVKSEKLNIVKDVLKYYPDVNKQSNKTSLKTAVLNGNYSYEKEYGNIVVSLLEYGLTVSPKDANDKDFLHTAVKEGFLKIVEDLLEINRDNLKDKQLLNNAVKSNQIEIVKALLKYNDIFCQNAKCITRALYFIQYRNPDMKTTGEIAKLLLNKGANVNAVCNDDEYALHGPTLLHLSAGVGNIELVRILLNKGANVHIHFHDTALHTAIIEGHKEVVEVLLEYGAIADSSTKNFETPLHLCARFGRPEIITTLLKFGADINSLDWDNRTPFVIACKKFHAKVVNLLLEYGSDININLLRNHTPLDYASTILYEKRREVAEDRSYEAEPEYTRWFNRFWRGGDYEYQSDSNTLDDISNLESIIKALNHHIMKMKTADLYVSDEYFSSEGYTKFYGLWFESGKEIASMKNEMINANISFYDILTKDTNSLEIYMKNKNVVQVLKSGNYETKFPIYASMIKNNFRKSMERKMLLEVSGIILNLLFKNSPQLPYICTDKILSFLDEKDLKTLMNLQVPSIYVSCPIIKEHNDFFFS